MFWRCENAPLFYTWKNKSIPDSVKLYNNTVCVIGYLVTIGSAWERRAGKDWEIGLIGCLFSPLSHGIPHPLLLFCRFIYLVCVVLMGPRLIQSVTSNINVMSVHMAIILIIQQTLSKMAINWRCVCCRHQACTDTAVPMCLVGNKADLRETVPDEQCVSWASGMRLAKVRMQLSPEIELKVEENMNQSSILMELNSAILHSTNTLHFKWEKKNICLLQNAISTVCNVCLNQP